eukprot:6810278-Alexandrium_andersonii.AAC.1
MSASLVGSEMCIRDSILRIGPQQSQLVFARRQMVCPAAASASFCQNCSVATRAARGPPTQLGQPPLSAGSCRELRVGWRCSAASAA